MLIIPNTQEIPEDWVATSREYHDTGGLNMTFLTTEGSTFRTETASGPGGYAFMFSTNKPDLWHWYSEYHQTANDDTDTGHTWHSTVTNDAGETWRTGRTYYIDEGSIYWTDSTDSVVTQYASAHYNYTTDPPPYTFSTSQTTSQSGSSAMDRYASAGVTTPGAGPLYYLNETIESIAHISGNETIDTTGTVTALTGTLTFDLSLQQFVPTSSRVTITVDSYTTKSDPDTISSTTFTGGSDAYTTTTITTLHGTTYTRATYWCTPFISLDTFLNYSFQFQGESNALHADWIWYFNPGSAYTDWTGLTLKLEDIYDEGDFTWDAFWNTETWESPLRDTTDIASFERSKTESVSDSYPQTSFTDDSYVSVRFGDWEFPTPSYTAEIDYEYTIATNYESGSTYSTTDYFSAFATRTVYSTGLPQYTVLSIDCDYPISNGGLSSFISTYTAGYEPVLSTQTVSAPYVLHLSGETFTFYESQTMFGWWGGFDVNEGINQATQHGPRYIEGFQVQPDIAQTDVVYQWIDANVYPPAYNYYHLVCAGNVQLGTPVGECPYDDPAIGFSNKTLSWDKSGLPIGTFVNDSGESATFEAFGGGNVSTVMMRADLRNDEYGRFRIGGRPNAPGSLTAFLDGLMSYTNLLDGSTSSGEISYSAQSVEMETDNAMALEHVAAYHVFTYYDGYLHLLPSWILLDQHVT